MSERVKLLLIGAGLLSGSWALTVLLFWGMLATVSALA